MLCPILRGESNGKMLRRFETAIDILYVHIILSVIITTLLFLLFGKSLKTNFSTLLFYKIVTSSLITLVFLFSLLTIDRSRSFYLLRLVDINSKINESKILGLYDFKVNNELIFDSGYEQRLQEQVKLGLIALEGNSAKLTSSGKLLYNVSLLSAKIFRLSGFNFKYTIK